MTESTSHPTIQQRALNRSELKRLHFRLEQLREAFERRFKWEWLIFWIIFTTGCLIHIGYYYASNWSIISMILLVLGPVAIWGSVSEFRVRRKNSKIELVYLRAILDAGEISVVPMTVKRAALLEEYRDEGNVYLLEAEDGQCLYLGDYGSLHTFDDTFPAKQLDIYTDQTFKYGIDRVAFSTGEKISPILVPGENKRILLEDLGQPADLQMDSRSFDQILQELDVPVNS